MVGLVALVLPLPASAQFGPTPEVQWNNYLGGLSATAEATSADDKPYGVLAHRLGATYVTGSTNAPLFPEGVTPPATNGGQDAFITGFDLNGEVEWSLLIGGEGEDVGRRMAFNPSDETQLYVVGTTSSPSIRNATRVLGSHKGGKDAFLARVELNGQLSWFMYLGDAGDEEGLDVHVYEGPNKSLVAYVVGSRDGEASIARVELPIISGDPVLTWSTHFGSPGLDATYAVAAFPQPSDQVYVGGIVRGPVSPSPKVTRVLNEFGGGESDGFFAEVNPQDGQVKWLKYLGGDALDDVRDIVYQAQYSRFVVVGNTSSTRFPIEATRPGQELFLVRMDYDSATNTISAINERMRLGAGNESTEAQAGVDTSGNVYVGGKTTSRTLALSAFDPTPQFGDAPENDGFVAMVDAELTGRVWTSYVGGATPQPEAVTGLYVAPQGQLAMVGHSAASTERDLFPKEPNRRYSGGQDGFVFRLKVNPDARPQAPGTVLESPLGWSCNSVSGGGSLSLLTLALLALRRVRRRSAR